MKKLLLGFLAGVVLAVGFAALAIVGPINSVTRMFAGDGTVNAPAYSFRSNTGMGFYSFSPGSGQFASANGGTTGMIWGATRTLANAPLGINDNGLYFTTSDTFPGDVQVTRVGAGTLKLANASNANGTLQFAPFTFANIATVMTVNGQVGYCSDCTIANPCAGAGTGALAKRLNGVNVCN